jgi:hypothetical protein
VEDRKEEKSDDKTGKCKGWKGILKSKMFK